MDGTPYFYELYYDDVVDAFSWVDAKGTTLLAMNIGEATEVERTEEGLVVSVKYSFVEDGLFKVAEHYLFNYDGPLLTSFAHYVYNADGTLDTTQSGICEFYYDENGVLIGSVESGDEGSESETKPLPPESGEDTDGTEEGSESDVPVEPEVPDTDRPEYPEDTETTPDGEDQMNGWYYEEEGEELRINRYYENGVLYYEELYYVLREVCVYNWYDAKFQTVLELPLSANEWDVSTLDGFLYEAYSYDENGNATEKIYLSYTDGLLSEYVRETLAADGSVSATKYSYYYRSGVLVKTDVDGESGEDSGETDTPIYPEDSETETPEYPEGSDTDVPVDPEEPEIPEDSGSEPSDQLNGWYKEQSEDGMTYEKFYYEGIAYYGMVYHPEYGLYKFVWYDVTGATVYEMDYEEGAFRLGYGEEKFLFEAIAYSDDGCIDFAMTFEYEGVQLVKVREEIYGRDNILLSYTTYSYIYDENGVLIMTEQETAESDVETEEPDVPVDPDIPEDSEDIEIPDEFTPHIPESVIRVLEEAKKIEAMGYGTKFDAQGRILEASNNIGTEIDQWMFQYDYLGNPVAFGFAHMESDSETTKGKVYTYSFEYDEKGNCVYESVRGDYFDFSISDEAMPLSEISYTYEVDEYGNVVGKSMESEEITYDEDFCSATSVRIEDYDVFGNSYWMKKTYAEFPKGYPDRSTSIKKYTYLVTKELVINDLVIYDWESLMDYRFHDDNLGEVYYYVSYLENLTIEVQGYHHSVDGSEKSVYCLYDVYGNLIEYTEWVAGADGSMISDKVISCTYDEDGTTWIATTENDYINGTSTTTESKPATEEDLKMLQSLPLWGEISVVVIPEAPVDPDEGATEAPVDPDEGVTEAPVVPDDGVIETPVLPDDGVIETPVLPDDGVIEETKKEEKTAA